MPQNRVVKLGQASRFLIFSFIFVACSTSTGGKVFNLPPAEDAIKVSKALEAGDWDQAADLTKNAHDPLLLLVYKRSLYEQENYDAVLKTKAIVDARFAPYDRFIIILSLFEAKKYAEVISFDIPDDLPAALEQRLLMIKGESERELKHLDLAEAAFKKFLKKYKGSNLESEVLFQLADVELLLQKRSAAVELFENIYKFHPIDDRDDLARKRLLEAGRFSRIDTDAHLARIHRLQQAAQFKRAEGELDTLKLNAPAKEKARVELAQAQLQFSQRRYPDVEKIAKKALKKPMPSDLEVEWRLLFASALTRQDKHDEGEEEYKHLLKLKVASHLKEEITYRLAMIAFDDEDYSAALKLFKELRDKYSNGRHSETAYWFGAFATYQDERSKENKKYDLNRLELASTLLDHLSHLPEGKNLESQALYWKGAIATLRGDDDEREKVKEEIQTHWNATFHSLLLKPVPFDFLAKKKEAKLAAQISTPKRITQQQLEFSKDLSWQRLEAFRSVGLKTWARMEIDRFVHATRSKDSELYHAVANRLADVGDWADLARWSDRYFELNLKDFVPDNPEMRYQFPPAYFEEVKQACKDFSISPFLVWGVMREESRFEADVVSKAGAIGLMQILPSRAAILARELKDPKPNLTNVHQNIRLGAYYLSQLRSQMNSLDVSDAMKDALTVASYNAGVEAVHRWVKQKDTSRLDLFVEEIPFTETRGYVKRVLQSASIYSRIYGDDQKSQVAKSKGDKEL